MTFIFSFIRQKFSYMQENSIIFKTFESHTNLTLYNHVDKYIHLYLKLLTNAPS